MVAEPLTDAFDIGEVGADLTAAVERVGESGRPVLLTRDGQSVAALVSVADAETARQAGLARLEAAFAEIGAKVADVPLDEIERQVKLAIAEVRAGATATE